MGRNWVASSLCTPPGPAMEGRALMAGPLPCAASRTGRLHARGPVALAQPRRQGAQPRAGRASRTSPAPAEFPARRQASSSGPPAPQASSDSAAAQVGPPTGRPPRYPARWAPIGSGRCSASWLWHPASAGGSAVGRTPASRRALPAPLADRQPHNPGGGGTEPLVSCADHRPGLELVAGLHPPARERPCEDQGRDQLPGLHGG